MTNENQVIAILERILETNCDPESACEACPELLPEVLERLRKVRRVEQQLDQLFPSSISSDTSNRSTTAPAIKHLPTITGYDVEGVLGSGGMGVVYKARHQKLNRVVALKMLRTGQFATDSELTRFTREFQAIAELQCTHIVKIHDVGDADGRPYFTMEYVEGGSLAEKLLGQPQPTRYAAEMVATLAEAIDSAHGRGIVHRDLKPANILLSKEGCPKIADFGLARHIECDHPLTISGVQLGTPSYMAPEQATGSSDSVGPAVDVYALGAILYEMLTGRPPFRADNALEIQRQVIHDDAIPPARLNTSVPRDLETICTTCLNKEPQRRYASAGALAEDLRRFLRYEPIHARPIGRLSRILKWSRRNPAISGLAGTGLALLILSTAFVLREFSASRERRAESEKWKERLSFVTQLEQQGRFVEARAILGRVPDGGSSELRHQIVQAQKDLDLAEQLDTVRMSRGKFTQGGGIDYDESSRQYAQVFRDAGIGTTEDKATTVADRIRISTVQVALVAALDDWAACATAETRAWILSVARATDPDPWRDQVRDQQNWADIEHLQRLAQAADIQHQPVTIMVAMGTRWRRLGGQPTEFLRRVHQVYPDDFWVNFELAVLNSVSDPAIALAHNVAALAIRPNAASVHFNLGVTYERLQHSEEAILHYTRAIELDPLHSWAEYRLGHALLYSGKGDRAISHFREALELDPSYKDAKNGLRIALLQQGALEEAASVWESTLSDPSATHADVDGYAELALYLGRDEKYHALCRTLLDRFSDSNEPFICERLGRTCLLKPSSSSVTSQAAELIDRALACELTEDQKWAKPYFQFAKALSEYRQDNFESAVEILSGDARNALPPGPDLVLAMSLHQLNQVEAAQEAMSRANQQLTGNAPDHSREQWLFKILCREATAMSIQSEY